MIKKSIHTGLTAGDGMVTTKLTPTVTVVTIVEVGALVLQVTPSLVPLVASAVIRMVLLAVTAVVLIVAVVTLEPPAATVKNPAAAEPQVVPAQVVPVA